MLLIALFIVFAPPAASKRRSALFGGYDDWKTLSLSVRRRVRAGRLHVARSGVGHCAPFFCSRWRRFPPHPAMCSAAGARTFFRDRRATLRGFCSRPARASSSFCSWGRSHPQHPRRLSRGADRAPAAVWSSVVNVRRVSRREGGESNPSVVWFACLRPLVNNSLLISVRSSHVCRGVVQQLPFMASSRW